MSEQVNSQPELSLEQRERAAIRCAVLWQMRFDRGGTDEEMDIWQYEAVTELDAMYPYTNCNVTVSGTGIHPNFNEAGVQIDDEEGHKENVSGVHAGFEVIDVGSADQPRYKIFHQVFHGEYRSSPHKTTFRREQISSFFNLDSRVISDGYIDQIMQVTTVTSKEDLLERFVNAREMCTQVNRLVRSKGFRQLDDDEKQQHLMRAVSALDAAAGLRDVYVDVLAERAFSFTPDGSHLQEHKLGNAYMSGQILGFEATEATRVKTWERAVRDKIVRCLGGVCLVLSPSLDTMQGLELEDGQSLYVPTSQQTWHIQSGV